MMPDTPVHVLIHAGYHKTGTTSLQNFMQMNRAALKPYVDYYGKADFPAAGAHARIYAQRPYPWRLWRFRRSIRRFLAEIDAAPAILLSRETLSGGMPGHRKIAGRLMMSYGDAAKPLAVVLVSEIKRRFGDATAITFLYTTREREAWIKSVYGHLLRSIRITQELSAFRAQFPDLPGPEAEAAAMAKSLHPIPVRAVALEIYGALPAGPATPLLDILNVPGKVRADLKPAKRSNTKDSKALQSAFLDLNRSRLGKAALKVEKERLLQQNRTTP